MNIKNFFDRIDAKSSKLIDEVREFLRMPSISATGEGIESTARFLRDFIVDRLDGEAQLKRYGGHPIVYGVVGDGDKEGIYYGMYDVQPVEPLEKWIAPPFEARIIDDKIIARGAYNTKGALLSSLLGLEEFKKEYGGFPMKIHFIIEGEEELASPSMPKLIDEMKDQLKGSITTLFTIPTEFIPGKPTIILGNKGIIYIDVKVKTSEYDVHSSYARGLYNPAVIASKIVDSLIDPIKGPKPKWLYKGYRKPKEEELKYIDDILEAMPPSVLKEAYGIYRFRFDDMKELVREIIFEPSLNVDGFCSGYCGEGTKTIVPSEASLKIDIRLVPDMDPNEVYNEFLNHIKDLGFGDMVNVTLREKYSWSQTSPDSKSRVAAEEAFKEIVGKPYIIYRLPGSAPMYLFTKVLGVDVISAGPGHGGRAHAPNEYITVDTIPKTAKFTPTYFYFVSKMD